MLWVGVSVAIAQGRGGGQARDNWTDNLPPGNGKDLAAVPHPLCSSLPAKNAHAVTATSQALADKTGDIPKTRRRFRTIRYPQKVHSPLQSEDGVIYFLT